MALDQVISQIRSLSSDPNNWQQLAESLQSEERELNRHKQRLQEALKTLDAAEHSLGYLYLLEAVGSSRESNQEFLELAASFVTNCAAEQIRVTPKKFVSLCRRLRDTAEHLNCPKRAIAPLLRAIDKLEPSPQYITPLHVFLFHMCLLAKCYNAAAPALSEEACELDPSKTALTPTDFLLYCYYGARIHIGRKRYGEALQLLLMALAAPTMVVNAITMAAYKKFVLVSLIHLGQVPQLPKFTSSSVSRAAKAEGVPYNDIEKAYSKPDADLDTVVNKHSATIAQDGNTGLLHLALEARTKRAIQRLTQTYLTLSLQHIAETVGLPSAAEAELHILSMIDSGEIFAEIDDARGMVRFSEDVEEYNSPELTTRLDAQIEQSVKLADKMQSINHMVSCDKAFLSKLGGRERGQRGSFEEMGDAGFEASAGFLGGL